MEFVNFDSTLDWEFDVQDCSSIESVTEMDEFERFQ